MGGNRRNKKPLKLKWVPKSKPAPVEMRNWLDLPRDVTVSILSRLRAVEILGSAQKVCMAWRHICKDPLMWRTIDMTTSSTDSDIDDDLALDTMCRHAVDRSCGNLVDINLDYFGSDDLLSYITKSCGRIRRLRLVENYDISDEGLSDVASKLPLLEELEISLCNFSSKPLEVIGRSCPLLKSFKFNNRWMKLSTDDWAGGFSDYDESDHENGGFAIDPFNKDDEALAIAGTMHGLHHLQLFGNQLTNDGLRKILDSCPHLESLDLRHCFNLNLKGDLGRICAERIKELRLPNDSILDYEYGGEYGFSDDCEDLEFYDYEDYCYDFDSDDSDFYDDFTKIRVSDFLF